MSNMLEQAIVDAEALKEAALQNAEQAVIEKYQAEIKNAVEALLEQDEEDPLEEPLDDEDGLESDEELAQQMPLAATGGDKLCPCPDDEEEVEIDFDQLAQQMQASDEEAGGGIPALDSPLALEEGVHEDDEEVEEEIQITEEELVDILEELTLDMEPTKAGWLQRPDSSVEHEIDILQTKVEEPLDVKELEEEDKDDKDLSEALKVLEAAENEIYRLEEKADKYKEMLLQMKNTLSEVNLQNAKLLYTNQTLVDDSLNERQKQKIVEAIMKSGSVEETKTIFEALQSTVGAQPNNKKVAPKSLSEAVERRSTTLPRRVEKDSHSFSDRMKILAGIN
jgi:hypothetical protein